VKHEPSVPEILKELKDAARYDEVVFCGFGEPTIRLDDMKEIAGELKKQGISVRLVTNGHGDLIHSRAIAGELKGLIDTISVSLNADSQEKYSEVIKPAFGNVSYESVLRFIRDCVQKGIETEVTCIDLPNIDLKKCRALAENSGASFRMRELNIVG
jgi:TatD DNase family protein